MQEKLFKEREKYNMKKLKLLFILLLGFTFTTVIKAETSLPSPTLSITGEFDEERGVYTSDVVINLC